MNHLAKIKQLLLIPVSLSLLAFTVSGCGEGDDGVYGSADNNELTLIRFDKSIDRQTNREAIARIETDYSKGERDVDITNIIGNFNNQNIDNLDNAIVLADNFEGTLENRYIEVNGRTIKRPIYQKNSNNQLNYETEYRTLNLSNVNAFDYQSGNNFNDSRGIFTALNTYPSLSNNAPNNLAFPAGSVCYIPVTTSERSFYTFNDRDRTSYRDINRWTDAAEKRFNDNRNFRTTEFSTGENNKNKAAQVKFFATNTNPEYLYSGIDYNNAIYEASYIDRDKSRPNEDSVRGVVDCSLVNKVAADFIEAQIRRYY